MSEEETALLARFPDAFVDMDGTAYLNGDTLDLRVRNLHILGEGRQMPVKCPDRITQEQADRALAAGAAQRA